MNSGRAEDLFRQIEERGLSAIEGFLSSRKEEELFLDFKRSADNGGGRKLHLDDRKNLSKAISGFGNSEGGIIVWGIDCSPDDDGADIAKTRFPIENADRFNAWIQGAISGCTIPPHTGVRSIVVRNEGSASGYVITLIPKSHNAPHQSTINSHFYIRAGSNFTPTPHAVLAGLFGKRPQPNVFLMYSVGQVFKEVDAYMSESINCNVGIEITNDGPGIARDVFVDIQVISQPTPKGVISFNLADRVNWVMSFAHGIQFSLICKEDFRIPPEFIAQPVIIKGEFRLPFEKPLKLKLKCGCDGGVPYQAEWVSTPENMLKCYEELIAMPDLANSGLIPADLFGIPRISKYEV